MEGVNTAFYRNAQHALFGGMGSVDKYFSPFLAPNNDGIPFKPKQIRDVLPEYNQSIELVPQILTNKSEDFIRAANEMKELGYQEVNLNLGCPSGTVVAKKKGSGLLGDLELLEQFLYEIFDRCEMKISVKTRLGLEEPEEFYKILELYNDFEISELIVHPRVRKDMYKNPPHLELFQDFWKASKNPICYNGDIFTPEDAKHIQERFPMIESVMIGRGLVTNPALIREIQTGEKLTKEELRKMHDRLYMEYQGYLSGDTNLLYRMKEYWYYMIHSFYNNKKLNKKLRKATKLSVYHEVVDEIFDTLEIGGYFSPYDK